MHTSRNGRGHGASSQWIFNSEHRQARKRSVNWFSKAKKPTAYVKSKPKSLSLRIAEQIHRPTMFQPLFNHLTIIYLSIDRVEVNAMLFLKNEKRNPGIHRES